MKTLIYVISLALLAGCGKFIEVEPLPDQSDSVVKAQPISIVVEAPQVVVTVGGDTINNTTTNSSSNNNTADGGTGGTSSATGGTSNSTSQGGSATGGSNTNQISSGNSSATGTGGTGGGASAGNSTSNANNSGSSNSTNSSTNSGSASNQANNSTSNSADNAANVSGSGNSTNSATVDVNNSVEFNVELGGNENYFKKAKKHNKKHKCTKTDCVDPQEGRNLLCHVYDFTGKSQLANDLTSALHLGSFYMDKFDVTARDWQQGFPKFPSSLAYLRENYAVRCFAKLRVATSGQHTFSITSDDGMRILLNNTPVVQDDSLHAPRTAAATTNLVAGLYDLEIQWFQGPRTQIAAELKWTTPSNNVLRYIEPTDMEKAVKLCE